MVHCPKCGVEIDLDEDEVEEGEIVTCVECEAEMEIVQTHPVGCCSTSTPTCWAATAISTASPLCASEKWRL